jgi:hypothetical protein
MFERIGKAAEALATNASQSRRGFLGRLGQGALAVGASLAGLASATAGPSGGVVCCTYSCFQSSGRYHYRGPTIKKTCQQAGTSCADLSGSGCRLSGTSTAAQCGSC